MDIHEHGGIFTGNPELGDIVGYPGLTAAQIAAQFATYRVVDGVGDTGWWMGGYEEMDVCYTRACRVARGCLHFMTSARGRRLRSSRMGRFWMR